MSVVIEGKVSEKTTYRVRDGFYLHLKRGEGDKAITTAYSGGELVELTPQEAIEGANQIEALPSVEADSKSPKANKEA
jgi:hypothetical protein